MGQPKLQGDGKYWDAYNCGRSRRRVVEGEGGEREEGGGQFEYL